MPTKPITRVVVLILGWMLIAIGVVGLFVPVLQGILFIMLGLYVLSRESRMARGWLVKLQRRYPEVHAAARRVKNKLKSWWSRTPRDES